MNHWNAAFFGEDHGDILKTWSLVQLWFSRIDPPCQHISGGYGRQSSTSSVIFCWCRGNNIALGIPWLPVSVSLTYPVILIKVFTSLDPGVHTWKMKKLDWLLHSRFWDSWYSRMCCLWLLLLAEREGKRKEGLSLKSLQPEGYGRRSYHSTALWVYKWIWWQ